MTVSSIKNQMTHPIEIDTPRLRLRSVNPGIIHQLFDTKDKQYILSFFETDDAGYEHLQRMHEKGMETHRISLFYFLLVDKATEKVIGECGFHSWNKSHARAEVFYNLRDDSYKRKGLMSEALATVLPYGFFDLGLHRIEALTASWNTASVKLLDNFGFTKEGTMREDYLVDGKYENSECYSLLRREWEKTAENKTAP